MKCTINTLICFSLSCVVFVSNAGKDDLIISYDLSVLEVWEVKITQEMCKSQGGRPGLHVPNSPYVLCGRKATLNLRHCLLTQSHRMDR